MKWKIPVKLLNILESLFSQCYSSVKWDNLMSSFFEIQFGVRQGSVLSPFLFAVYVDDLCKLCIEDRMQFIFVYADDIILICPSVVGLEDLLHQCENELNSIDVAINTNKSNCLRIGNRNDKHCANLKTLDGRKINWSDQI